MNRYFPKNKTALLTVIVLLFAIVIFLLPCCKKKDQPQQNQQTSVSQESEQITASESAELPEPIEKIDLCILYAGMLNSDRAKDFTEFLSKHFEKVETTDYNSFTGNVPINFDVAVIDSDRVEFKAPIPNISPMYSRATVTVGVPGGRICNRLSLKTGYL